MFETLKVIHLIAILMGGGASIGGAILSRQVAMSGQPPSMVIMHTSATMGQVGLVAIILLWLSGIPMAMMLGSLATAGAAFWLKLVFATVVLLAVIGMTRARISAAKAGRPINSVLVTRLSLAARFGTILAIIFAVVAFN